jgi:hypothetical protein
MSARRARCRGIAVRVDPERHEHRVGEHHEGVGREGVDVEDRADDDGCPEALVELDGGVSRVAPHEAAVGFERLVPHRDEGDAARVGCDHDHAVIDVGAPEVGASRAVDEAIGGDVHAVPVLGDVRVVGRVAVEGPVVVEVPEREAALIDLHQDRVIA